MIDHLTIRNFRIFKSLDINGLKQVNLCAGRNNTGKTILLEALRIWAGKGDYTVVNHILTQRGEFTKGWNDSYDALFNRTITSEVNVLKNIELHINKLSIERNQKIPNQIEYLVNWNEKPVVHLSKLDASLSFDTPKDQSVFIPFGKDAGFPLSAFWDKIVLTPLEDDVMHIVRETVLPGLIRLDVNKERTLVRIEGEDKPMPLKTFGEGVERMLMLAAGLVNAKNGLLLIDEIEAGLHHSVMEIFWDKIFFYAQKWNIQVFATTHSQDTVKTFTYALEKPENFQKGAYFRLQKARKSDDIEVIYYDQEQLEFSLEKNLETR